MSKKEDKEAVLTCIELEYHRKLNLLSSRKLAAVEQIVLEMQSMLKCMDHILAERKREAEAELEMRIAYHEVQVKLDKVCKGRQVE